MVSCLTVWGAGGRLVLCGVVSCFCMCGIMLYVRVCVGHVVYLCVGAGWGRGGSRSRVPHEAAFISHRSNPLHDYI